MDILIYVLLLGNKINQEIEEVQRSSRDAEVLRGWRLPGALLINKKEKPVFRCRLGKYCIPNSRLLSFFVRSDSRRQIHKDTNKYKSRYMIIPYQLRASRGFDICIIYMRVILGTVLSLPARWYYMILLVTFLTFHL